MHDLNTAKSLTDQIELIDILKDWTDMKPQNRELKKVVGLVYKLIFEINRLDLALQHHTLTHSDQIEHKNREILQLRKQIDELISATII